MRSQILLSGVAGVISALLMAAQLSAQYTPVPPQQQPREGYRPPAQQPPRSAYQQPAPSQYQQQPREGYQPQQQPPNGYAQPLPPARNTQPRNIRLAEQTAPQGPPQYNAVQQAGGVQGVEAQPPVAAPFQLTAEDLQLLDDVLGLWETESDKIKNFACPFERWEYDPVFGPSPDIPKTKGYGDLKYVRPDKGRFRIEKQAHYTPAADPNQPPTYQERKDDLGEHWVCDGKAVYEYKFDTKQLVVYELPEEMRGKAIADGPLPFLFGAKKDKLKARYLMKVTNVTDKDYWIDAWPRYQHDAANFQHVELILDRQKLLPTAMQVYMPNGKSRMVYIFKEASVNSTVTAILGDWFEQPRTPFGWKKVIERAPSAEDQAERRASRPQRPTSPMPGKF